jgi:hypothetical protein
MDKDTVIFDGKSFADLMKDIYNNSRKKDEQIKGLIDQLKPLIKNVSDAAAMVPLIKEYLEVSVKNDEHLVRLAAIVQRLLVAAGKNDEDSGGLSDAERAQLMQEAQDLLDKQVV